MVALYRSLPPEALQPCSGPEWGPLETLIHLAFWHEQYAANGEALRDGRPPPLLAGTFKYHNRRSVEENREVPAGQLLARLESAHRRLMAAAGSPSAPSWRLSFRAGSRAWTMAKALQLIAGHVELHGRRVHRATRTGRRPRAASVRRGDVRG